MTRDRDAGTQRDQATRKRRRLILESAAACFVEKGFHQASVRDIAGKAGISLGNLYNHFDGKEALIAEIADLEAEELGAIAAQLDGTAVPLKAIERFAVAYFDHVSQPENAVLAAEISAEALRNPEIAAGFVDNRERLVLALTQALRAGEEAGILDLQVSRDAAANLILDLAEAAALRMAFGKRGERGRSRKEVLAMIRKMVLA